MLGSPLSHPGAQGRSASFRGAAAAWPAGGDPGWPAQPLSALTDRRAPVALSSHRRWRVYEAAALWPAGLALTGAMLGLPSRSPMSDSLSPMCQREPPPFLLFLPSAQKGPLQQQGRLSHSGL